MDLQSVFYIVSIIFMLTVITLVITSAFIVYYIRKKVIKLSRIASRPAEATIGAGIEMFGGIISKIRDIFGSKKS